MTTRKDSGHCPTANRQIQRRIAAGVKPLPTMRETAGASHGQQYRPRTPSETAAVELQKILATLQSESEYCLAAPSTSSEIFETQIAQCIARSLGRARSRRYSVRYIRRMLRDYKVVRSLPDGGCSVSLQRVQWLLQDNFLGSSLCILFDILLGARAAQSKVITFF